MTVTRELRTGMTPAGETRHACWVDAASGRVQTLTLCHRYWLIKLFPVELTEPNCEGCIRAVRAADRAAAAVMNSVLDDMHGTCEVCKRERWTLRPWLGGVLACLVCVEAEANARYRVTVYPPGRRVWGSNADHRAHHFEVARHRAAVREQAGWSARAARIPPMRRARVAITVHLHGYKRADATNYPGGATVKAALDGLVDAGVVASDRPEHLDVAMPVLAPLDGDHARVVLEITEDQDGEAP